MASTPAPAPSGSPALLAGIPTKADAGAGDGTAAVPEVVCLQPIAVVDHVCSIEEGALKGIVNDEVGGSRRVSAEEVQALLANVGEFHSKAGGSAANTARGLAAGFGVKADLVGARGFDEWGVMFVSSMKRSTVGTAKLRVQQGPTGRCVILSCNGQRTMRTCLSDGVRLTAGDLGPADFAGAKWVFLSAYCLYGPGLLERAVELAVEVGAQVALDLASFEVVRAFRPQLAALLETGHIDCCFCNEDEAAELGKGSSDSQMSTEQALGYLARHCALACVTLGERGCIAQRRGEDAVVREPAAKGVTVVDATGAGDLFASGFLYGLLRGFPLQRCCEIGCLAGGAVVQNLGAEMSAANWRWMFSRLHGDLAAGVARDSAAAVHQELLACYALIERLGRGCVYYGSARLGRSSAHWPRAQALAREVAALLGSPTWSGGGPGMMEAATLGALEAGKVVGGIRIAREAGTTVRSASYLPPESAVFCRFLSSRKVALVDSGVRMTERDRTAYIFLPGGLGTMDELFEILTLMQLKKLGSKFPVPLILCDYDSFYGGLMAFLRTCDRNGTVGAAELGDVVLAADNDQVLDSLAAFYGIERPGRPLLKDFHMHRASSWIAGDSPAFGSVLAAGATNGGEDASHDCRVTRDP